MHSVQLIDVLQAFSPAALRAYLPVMSDVFSRMLHAWSSAADAAPGGPGVPVADDLRCVRRKLDPIYRAGQLITRINMLLFGNRSSAVLEIALRTLLGQEESDLAGGRLQEIAQLFSVWGSGFFAMPSFSLPFFPSATAYGRALAARGGLLRIMRDIADRRRKALARAPTLPPRDALGFLLASPLMGEGDDADARLLDSLLTIAFAGHVTTATAGTQLLLNLSTCRPAFDDVEADWAGWPEEVRLG